MPLDPAAAERLADLEDLHADEPEDALPAFLLATEYAKAGLHAQALPVFEAAIIADPGYSAASAGVGQCLEALGRMDEARAAWSATAALATLKGDHMVAKQADAAVKRLG